MKARLALTLLPLVLRAAALAAPPEGMVDPPPFKETVEVNVVNVDVRVTDAKGNPVTGLRKKDFELLEDGTPGEQRLAVGVRDDVSATASYLSRAVTVGTAAAIVRP